MSGELMPTPPGFRDAVQRQLDVYLEEMPRGDALGLAEAWSSGMPVWEAVPGEDGRWWLSLSVTTGDGVLPVFDVRLDRLGYDLAPDGALIATG